MLRLKSNPLMSFIFFVFFAKIAWAAEEVATVVEETTHSYSFFDVFTRGGFVGISVMLLLVFFSIATWAIVFAKFASLKKMANISQDFIKTFWDSRSLNELNTKLNDYPYSPAREVFRTGYAELVRASQLKDNQSTEVILNVAVDNLTRSLGKSRAFERKKLEKYLSFLAICASSAPFIGLFGTVWGIMTSFQSIARSGTTSLTAVAPGISEALIATAFGLAAAIPAAIFYNVLNNRIRGVMLSLEGFSADFLNIVGRYFVSEKSKNGTFAGHHQDK